MSFKSYACIVLPDGSWRLDEPQPLVFSGRHGLIARFIEQNGKRAAEPWKLCPGELHSLALPGEWVRERVIVFEQADGCVQELMWLRDIRGFSGETTEMLFTFTPLTVASTRPQLVVREPNLAHSYGEDLVLDGGVTNPRGCWCWRKPHLALGGVKLGPAKPAMAARPASHLAGTV